MLASAGCSDPIELRVDLRTDYRPDVEFTTVQIALRRNGSDDVLAMRSLEADSNEDFVQGTSVARFDIEEAGTYSLEVTLSDGRNHLRATRRVVTPVRSRTGITAVIFRSCSDVSCPPADDPDATECWDGRCVPPECSPETPDACPEESCFADEDCPLIEGCVSGRCVDGTCLEVFDDAACGAEEICCPGTATCEPETSCTAGAPIVQAAYIKASNTGEGDRFGMAIAQSADGNTLAVGAWEEDSAATSIDGNQSDESADGAGAVYVFVRSGRSWVQQAYIKASNTDAGDGFGLALAISGDGNTLAVGAWREGSASSAVNGEQSDNSATKAGAAYVFIRSGDVWAQEAYIKASNAGPYDYFGSSLAMSDDGDTLVVGSPGEDSGSTGVDGVMDEGQTNSGAVYVYTRSADGWAQKAFIKASNPDRDDRFGSSVTLSDDANTLAIGAWEEDSDGNGVDADQRDNDAPNSGAVYVFVLRGESWEQQAYIKASNSETEDTFGYQVSLSLDGNALAVGAPIEGSASSGVGGPEDDNTAPAAGAAYVFIRNGERWSQQAYIKASNTDEGDRFGNALELNPRGTFLLVGAPYESSRAAGINGDELDNSSPRAGAAYTYVLNGENWVQQAYIKPSNTRSGFIFGHRVTMNRLGTLLVIAADKEPSAGIGIDPDSSDTSASEAGAVYVFRMPEPERPAE